MAKGVFITRVAPDYDDLPEERYHFPRMYLSKAQQTVGDWILYYEPRRGDGRQVYFATSRVREVQADPRKAGHFYAYVEHYLEFPRPVPFREGDEYYESALRYADGSVNLGLFQRAIHLLPDHEYELIVQRGMGAGVDLARPAPAAGEMVAEPEADYGRPAARQLTVRKFRDAAFQRVIRQAYDGTCAMTGIKMVNGGGHCEVQAAHIRSIESNGPDSPRNGLALSQTIHWAFDRGLLSLEDDGKILMARKLVPDRVKAMLNREGFIRMPESAIWRPHPQFLSFHRDHVFKG